MSKICPNCGITLIDTEAVCSNCGYNLETKIKQNKYSDTNIIYTSKMAKLIDLSGKILFWLTILSITILLVLVISDNDMEPSAKPTAFIMVVAVGISSIFTTFIIRGFSYIVEKHYRDITK